MAPPRSRAIAFAAATMIVVGVVLHAALRPYEFFVPNGVAWTDTGLRFSSRGIAAARGAIRLDTDDGFTVALRVRRSADAAADGGVVVAIGEGDGLPPLLLAQWQDRLYFRFVASEGAGDTEQTLSLPPAAVGSWRSIVFAASADGVRIHADGERVRLPPGKERALRLQLRGRISLGSRLRAQRPWRGEIGAIAIWDRSLTNEELWDRAESALNDATARGDRDRGPVTRIVMNAGSAATLELPRWYRTLDPHWLRLRPGDADRAIDRRDAVLNALAFIPLGGLAARWLRGRRARGIRPLLGATALVAIASLGIETMQVWLPSRVSSALDLALNTAGAAAGAAAEQLWDRASRALSGRLRE